MAGGDDRVVGHRRSSSRAHRSSRPRWPRVASWREPACCSRRCCCKSSHPSAWLMATLALAGYGFGSSVVPMTSVTLSEVPPGAFGHGGVGHEYESRTRRGLRRGGPGCARQRAIDGCVGPSACAAQNSDEFLLRPSSRSSRPERPPRECRWATVRGNSIEDHVVAGGLQRVS